MAPVFAAIGGMFTSMMAGLTSAGGIASLIGTGLSAAGTIYSGVRAKQEAEIQAKVAKKKGEQELAAGQREALHTQRQKNLVLSRQQAIAASSGGGAQDETIRAIMQKTEAEGEYSAAMDMYNGYVRKSDLDTEAANIKASGRSAFASSLFEAGGSLYSAYGKYKRPTYDSLYG